jgi:hypothetical protein
LKYPVGVLPHRLDGDEHDREDQTQHHGVFNGSRALFSLGETDQCLPKLAHCDSLFEATGKDMQS